MYDAAAAAAYAPRTRVGERRTHQIATPSAGESPAPRRDRSVPRPWEIALVIAVTVAIVVVTLLAGGAAHRSSALSTRTVRVAAADTLWNIAQANPVAGQSTAATVEQIRAVNGLRTSAVSEGTTLRVPLDEAPDRSYASR